MTDCRVDDRGATPLALLFHELATNATKYGALSTGDGRVALVLSVDKAADLLRISWAETGGPTVPGEPARVGFGSRLAEISVVQQLGGELSKQWLPDGLKVDIAIACSRLSREGP